jgi:hypothetical protein
MGLYSFKGIAQGCSFVVDKKQLLGFFVKHR